jgi:hypothetical protein
MDYLANVKQVFFFLSIIYLKMDKMFIHKNLSSLPAIIASAMDGIRVPSVHSWGEICERNSCNSLPRSRAIVNHCVVVQRKTVSTHKKSNVCKVNTFLQIYHFAKSKNTVTKAMCDAGVILRISSCIAREMDTVRSDFIYRLPIRSLLYYSISRKLLCTKQIKFSFHSHLQQCTL